MKILYFSVLFLSLIACSASEMPGKRTQNNRKEILGRNFSDAEVLSIDILDIEHPMLGGVTDSLTLSTDQKKTFLSRFDQLVEKGMYKCGKIQVIRLNFEKDTLRLKVCGNKISNRTSDLYYELKNGADILKGLTADRF